MPPTPSPFRYRARIPAGFVRAAPGAGGVWHLGPGTTYAPLGHQLEHFATPSSDAQASVFALAAAPFAGARGDPAAWARAVSEAVGDDRPRFGPGGDDDPDARPTSPAPAVFDRPGGLGVLTAWRRPTARGAIDRYTWVAERGPQVYVVRLQVTGSRPVDRVARWLAAFCTAPFGVACERAWVFPEAPPLRPPPPPRDNQ